MKVYILLMNDRVLDVFEDPIHAHDRLIDEMDSDIEPNGEWVCSRQFDIDDTHELERWYQKNGPVARLAILPYWVVRL